MMSLFIYSALKYFHIPNVAKQKKGEAKEGIL
jgi:hypothetical protein